MLPNHRFLIGRVNLTIANFPSGNQKQILVSRTFRIIFNFPNHGCVFNLGSSLF